MIENFLRRPQNVTETSADIIRGIGALSVIVAAVWLDLTAAAVLALALPGLLLPRFIGVHAWVDIAMCAILLVTAWSNPLDLYARISAWDLVTHFMCTAALATMSYLLLHHVGVIGDPEASRWRVSAKVLSVTILGLALSALWEMIEWLGHNYISDEIFVAYSDTIGDMAAGGLGAAGAGFLLAFVPLLRRTQQHPIKTPSHIR